MGSSIVAGVISGVIASLIVSIALFGIKPRIDISKEMCRDYLEDCYLIKIVNRTRFNLADVKYSLCYCTRTEDGIGIFTEIQPLKSRLEYLEKYSKKDTASDYAVRLSYKIPEDLKFLEKDQLVFTIFAKHSLSGTVRFWTKTYTMEDIKCGVFETGKSTKIIQEKCGHKHKDCWDNGTCIHPAHQLAIK